ncbi:transposase [Schlesneria sp. DSM 10557]|uniref:transposase n=1 Tax=Schlesneria sp. DSM 10557 TaxID=3044399 RepID=UPI0035A00FA3
MARLARAEVFAPDEVAVVHVMNRVVRRCFLLGTDSLTGKNYDHRKGWIEDLLKRYAVCFGIDLLGFAILSNHFHLILRSRPDVVATWDKAEVARRWLLLCPLRKDDHGNPLEPNQAELDFIQNDPRKLEIIRLRLSDIGWWMRLLCQTVAMRANHEDHEIGRFWQSRFRAVRLLDEAALVACAAYVDLNPIRAAITDRLETSDYTSVQRRLQTQQNQSEFRNTVSPSDSSPTESKPSRRSVKKTDDARTKQLSTADQFLAPLPLDERNGKTGPVASCTGARCSDKGFLPMTQESYLRLLHWTAKQLPREQRGRTSPELKEVLSKLDLNANAWLALVRKFGRLFYNVAGRPQTIELTRSRIGQHRHYVRRETREVFS